MKNHLAALAGVTIVTAYFSFGYFHIDEYFQVLELTRFKLGMVGDPLPWEHAERLRPWLQPAIYTLVAYLTGVRDVFRLAFEARLITGLANVGAIWLLLAATLPMLPDEADQKRHLRILTLLGFLPYLFVRTSSESASTAALTAGVALLLLERPALGGLCLGLAFEFRFQTAFASAGILVWLIVNRKRWWPILPGAIAALVLGTLADRWGYGEWQFPAWTYFKANILEGAAGTFGTDPPFAYLWLSPANVFLPVVVAFMICAVLAWRRAPKHPLTAATLPFVLIHCLISHKEERFLFPIIPLVAAEISLVVKPRLPRVLVGWNFFWMGVLAFIPLGWHTNARFMRWEHDHIGDELHAIALPEINLNFPAFRPRIYDVQKADPEEIARRVAVGSAPKWLIADFPAMKTGTALDSYAKLAYTELPFYETTLPWIDWYNAHAFGPLRQVHFRTMYRLDYP